MYVEKTIFRPLLKLSALFSSRNSMLCVERLLFYLSQTSLQVLTSVRLNFAVFATLLWLIPGIKYQDYILGYSTEHFSKRDTSTVARWLYQTRFISLSNSLYFLRILIAPYTIYSDSWCNYRFHAMRDAQAKQDLASRDKTKLMSLRQAIEIVYASGQLRSWVVFASCCKFAWRNHRGVSFLLPRFTAPSISEEMQLLLLC